MIAQPIKARTIEIGTAVAVVAIDMLLVKVPGGLCCGVLLETGKLLLNGLCLLLTVGRDPDIHRDLHRVPPVGVARQGRALPIPMSTVEGTGRRYPSAAGHLAA
jgi:hypothetical protein